MQCSEKIILCIFNFINVLSLVIKRINLNIFLYLYFIYKNKILMIVVIDDDIYNQHVHIIQAKYVI